MDPATAPHVTWLPKGRFCAFATQILVPKDGVSEATFYMCGGLFCGYCGIQQHASGRQSVLFSVWNASAGARAEAIEAGPGVTLSCFGGEGMGAKGSMDYLSEDAARWQPDMSYTFLVRAQPEGNEATIFSCYFHRPEKGGW
ncbi:unnamed protein product [Polarella glacialis]|uniref:DUF5077 domain-containing protein n=1 Tax=Polarella glacialis TaxID=89957 RepID=A0A813D746_POLGL|nr:unnamed protein product [Polarella glacialis]